MSIRIVLVGTTHPGNIGAVARAMKNMGLSDLALPLYRLDSRTEILEREPFENLLSSVLPK